MDSSFRLQQPVRLEPPRALGRWGAGALGAGTLGLGGGGSGPDRDDVTRVRRAAVAETRDGSGRSPHQPGRTFRPSARMGGISGWGGRSGRGAPVRGHRVVGDHGDPGRHDHRGRAADVGLGGFDGAPPTGFGSPADSTTESRGIASPGRPGFAVVDRSNPVRGSRRVTERYAGGAASGPPRSSRTRSDASSRSRLVPSGGRPRAQWAGVPRGGPRRPGVEAEARPASDEAGVWDAVRAPSGFPRDGIRVSGTDGASGGRRCRGV